MPEDRPESEVIEDDNQFDGWLEEMERKAKRRAAKARLIAAKNATE
jgi:hypothetical protein